MEAYNIISNKENNNQEKHKFVLLHNRDDQEKLLGNLNTYIPILMNTLWDNPNIVAELIINSNNDDLKNNIAPFICNNFYENILSSNYIEEQLLYVISIVLKDEINNKIKTKEDINNFLENSSCGILMEQMKFRQDIQTYFKSLIYKIIEKIEGKFSSFVINFDVKKIEEDFKAKKQQMEIEFKATGKKQKVTTSDYFKKTFEEFHKAKNIDQNREDKELFNVKYIPSLTKDEYKKLIDKNNNNKIISDFLLSNWNLCNDNPNIYSNETLIKNVFQSELSNQMLASYQIDFIEVIKILDELIKSFLEYISLLPYSIKCICKMIFILIKKKFPDLSLAEQNAYISKFFFNKLFSTFFENPGTWALINNFIISGITKYNLKIISFLIKKIFSMKLFFNEVGSGDYTPFNWFIIDQIPDIYTFLENLTLVELPSFIDKYLNDELSNSYEYNYFKEHPEEEIYNRAICFSFNDLCAIINNMENEKEVFFPNNKNLGLKKTLEKLTNKSSREIIEEIKKNVQYDTIKIFDIKKNKELKGKKGDKILHYIFLTDILTNNNYTKIFNIKEENCFSPEEKNMNNNKDNKEKMNLAKVKLFLYKLLNNYRLLNKTDFLEGTTNSIIDILKELKKFMKGSNFIIDGSIPSQWYVDSILEYFKQIPLELISNDYSNLFNEIIAELNASINDLDFNSLSIILSNLKYCKRNTFYYQEMKKCLIDIELNEKVQNIIDNFPISVEIELKYSDKIKELKIEKSNKKDAKLESIETFDDLPLKEDFRKTLLCKTINAFTKKFPNLYKYQLIIEKKEKNWMDIEKDFQITNKIKLYFNLIKENLLNKKNIANYLINSTEFEEMSNKIYDYIFEKIYDKLIPKEPEPIDDIIFAQCLKFEWLESKNLIESKTNYIFDSFLPDTIQYFKEMDNQKSPRQKFIYMSKIFESISNLVKFSGGSDIGTDNLSEILNFVFIKAKPTYIYSNCQFMSLLIGDKSYREEGHQLTQLFAACKFVENLTQDNLIEIDEKKILNIKNEQ